MSLLCPHCPDHSRLYGVRTTAIQLCIQLSESVRAKSYTREPPSSRPIPVSDNPAESPCPNPFPILTHPETHPRSGRLQASISLQLRGVADRSRPPSEDPPDAGVAHCLGWTRQRRRRRRRRWWVRPAQEPIDPAALASQGRSLLAGGAPAVKCRATNRQAPSRAAGCAAQRRDELQLGSWLAGRGRMHSAGKAVRSGVLAVLVRCVGTRELNWEDANTAAAQRRQDLERQRWRTKRKMVVDGRSSEPTDGLIS